MPTPMVSSPLLSATSDSIFSYRHLCRSTVGALQYLTVTRPDIAFSINKICQYMQKPLDQHGRVVEKLHRYIKDTKNFGLILKLSSNLLLRAFNDDDWASCIEDRKSTTGFCIFLGPNLVSWAARKQHPVSRSSTEAEYRIVLPCATELCWF